MKQKQNILRERKGTVVSEAVNTTLSPYIRNPAPVRCSEVAQKDDTSSILAQSQGH